MSDYKVTICCVTYNHEKFIIDALEGFVMQKTNFPFQVLVGDDASTDATAEIVCDFAKKYPDVIKPVLHKNNIGAFKNSLALYLAAKTDYVAVCDGDDYWTDENKLQKQVDFLDTHPDYSLCFHPVHIVEQSNPETEKTYPDQKLLQKVRELNLSSLLKCNFIQTNSVMYRWRFKNENILNYWSQEITPGDYYLNLLHAQVGKIGFLPDVMAVYRKNCGGVWTGANRLPEWFCRCGVPHIKFFIEMEKSFHVSKIYEKEYFSAATGYAAYYLRNEALQKQLPEIRKPSKRKELNLPKLFILKFLKKVAWGSRKQKYKAKYNALKLYISWLDNLSGK